MLNLDNEAYVEALLKDKINNRNFINDDQSNNQNGSSPKIE